MTPSSVVVDASVAVKWVLPEEWTDRAQALMAASIQARQRLVGTPHLFIEVVNAIYQRRRRGAPQERLSETEADQALARFLAFPLALLGRTPLYEQACAFARTHGLSNVYDSAYVVLAQLLNTTYGPQTRPCSMPWAQQPPGCALFILTLVMALLQRERWVSYWALKQEFGLDDAFIEGLKQELIVAKRVAIDEGGQVLVWAGEVALPATQAVVQSTPIEAAITLPPPAQTLTPHATPTATPADAPANSPAPEAERRQVTVLFCDLVDSTKLSQHLDAEDYRAVVRAYQQAAVTALQPWDGYVAQYLGDGLMVYFGWPTAHEDAAVRAVHASLALLAALKPLNDTQLEPRYGVRVQVRLGLHTGMAVIGDMGGGDRYEQLAMGDTPNIAARLQGLADPDTVALSAVTARMVQRRFALEPLGTHELKGVTEPMQVFQEATIADAVRIALIRSMSSSGRTFQHFLEGPLPGFQHDSGPLPLHPLFLLLHRGPSFYEAAVLFQAVAIFPVENLSWKLPKVFTHHVRSGPAQPEAVVRLHPRAAQRVFF